MENVLNSDSGTNSIVSPQNNMVVSIEVCSIFVLRTVKNIETKVFVSVFMFFIQAPIPEENAGTIEPYSSWMFAPIPKGD